MNCPYTEPEYRVERYAADAEAGRAIANWFRRLFGLTIKRTPKEAGDDIRRSYLLSGQDPVRPDAAQIVRGLRHVDTISDGAGCNLKRTHPPQ